MSGKTNIQADTVKRNDFKQAAVFLLTILPASMTTTSHHRISTVNDFKRKGKSGKQGKIKVGPKTGVEVRYPPTPNRNSKLLPGTLNASPNDYW